MSDIEQLQGLWQSQGPAASATAADRAPRPGLDQALRRSEAREVRLSRAKTWITALLLLALAVTFPRSFLGSSRAVLGFAWSVLCAAAFLAAYWRWQFRVSRLPFAESTRDFVGQTLRAHARHLKMLRVGLPLLVGALTLGWNVMGLDASASLRPLPRLALHGGFTLAMAVAGWAGFRLRMRRYRAHLEPNIAELARMQRELDDNREPGGGR